MAGAKDGAAGGLDVTVREPKGGPWPTVPFPGHDCSIRQAGGLRQPPGTGVTAWLSLAVHIAMLPEAGQEPQWATRPHS